MQEVATNQDCRPGARAQASVVWVDLVTVLVFCGFLFFYGLGSFGLVGADEPRYAQIAREMLNRHDWVTPVLNGVPWLEKPVLYYWGAMISYGVFGVSDWAARVPSAVLATAMVLAAWCFMRRFRTGSESDAAIIMACLAAVIGFSRAASTDMPLTATFTIGMLAWFVWLQTERKRWLSAFYVFMALGTLAKGPIAAALAAMIIGVFIAVRRDWTVLKKSLWVPGLLLYLAVMLPWYVAVQHANPQFMRVFIFEHNVARFGTNMFQHKQPFWYYVPVLLVGLIPWVAPALAGWIRAIREGVAARTERTGGFELFFALWAVIPVVFFSFSQSKLPGYILPAFPAYAILTADWLRARAEESSEPALWLIVLHSLISGALLGFALETNYFVLRLKPTTTAIAIGAVAGILVFTAMMATIRAKGLRMIRFVTLVPVVVGLAFVIRFASPSIDAKNSARPVAREIARLEPEKVPVAVMGVPRELEYGLNFYDNQPISRYERGEVPASNHVLVVKRGTEEEAQKFVGTRKLEPLGEFATQKLEILWVEQQ